jgi:hypothetical protein
MSVIESAGPSSKSRPVPVVGPGKGVRPWDPPDGIVDTPRSGGAAAD